MKKLNEILLLALLITISSCNPSISTDLSKEYSALDYSREVVVIKPDKKNPDNAEVLGQVEVGDTGFSTKCSYDIVIDKAKLEARKAGGNAIKITRHKPPDFWSDCHRITADILKIEKTDDSI
ncbi:MAG: hypothetical protein K9I74_01670 [Bacteroidales bacterium]|nr:hypothetical protein [Bacteroidales bacterium]